MEILNNEKARRFEAAVEGGTAFLRYHIEEPEKIHLLYVEVPVESRGRGIAAELASHALEFARERALKVIPVCSYVVAYLQRHPEYAPLVAK